MNSYLTVVEEAAFVDVNELWSCVNREASTHINSLHPTQYIEHVRSSLLQHLRDLRHQYKALIIYNYEAMYYRLSVLAYADIAISKDKTVTKNRYGIGNNVTFGLSTTAERFLRATFLI